MHVGHWRIHLSLESAIGTKFKEVEIEEQNGLTVWRLLGRASVEPEYPGAAI